METASKIAWWRRPLTLTAVSAALIVAFFVAREHWQHALGYLPYGLLLLCPLMHLLHHGHHGERSPPNAQHDHTSRPL